jgi:hypothetical protein
MSAHDVTIGMNAHDVIVVLAISQPPPGALAVKGRGKSPQDTMRGRKKKCPNLNPWQIITSLIMELQGHTAPGQHRHHSALLTASKVNTLKLLDICMGLTHQ